MLILFLIFWIICAILSAGYAYAYFQKKYPSIAYEERYVDLFRCWMPSFFGPFALISAFLTFGTFEYGFLNPFKVNK